MGCHRTRSSPRGFAYTIIDRQEQLGTGSTHWDRELHIIWQNEEPQPQSVNEKTYCHICNDCMIIHVVTHLLHAHPPGAASSDVTCGACRRHAGAVPAFAQTDVMII
eukprot:2398120-Amphidinium_carterae.1